MMKKKKSVKHSSGLPQESHKDSGREHRSAAAPDGQQKKAETHGKVLQSSSFLSACGISALI